MTVKFFKEQKINEAYVEEGVVKLAESTIDSPTGKKLRTVEGVAAKAGVINRNLRIYGRSVFENAVNKAKAKLTANKYLGELEHPDEIQTSLARAAVRFTDLWMEGDDLHFKGVILPTPMGNLLESLLESGVGIGVSTRGYGSYKVETINGQDVEVIQDDYRMPGIDFVLDESNPHGAVNKFESQKPEGGMNVEIKNVEQLKAHFPELTAELVDAAKLEGAEAKEAELKPVHEAEVKVAGDDAVKAYKESDEGKKFESAFNTVVESLKPFLPETIKLSESELGKEVSTLKAAVQTKDGELADAKQKLALAENKLTAIDAQKKVSEAIEVKIKGHKFEGLLRGRLADAKTEDEVNTKFESEVSFLESLGMKDLPAGQGIQNEDEHEGGKGGAGGTDPDKTTKLTEKQQKMRKLAGLQD